MKICKDQVFVVPLLWILEGREIKYKNEVNDYVSNQNLIPNLRTFMFGAHETDDHHVPIYEELGEKLLLQSSDEQIYVSLDLQTFKCKPVVQKWPL